MNTHEHELLIEHLHGRLTPEKHAALNDLLRRDAEAREWLRTESALEMRLRALASERQAQIFVQPRTVLAPSRWFSWRPLTAAAAGILFGLFSASLGYARWVAVPAVAVPLHNAGFETGPVPGTKGISNEAGRWGGDVCAVVAAEQQVVPREGAKMLRFLSPVAEGETEREQFTVADQWMLLDAAALPLHEGARTLRLSAWFNRAADATEANNRFGVGLYAFTGSVSDGASLWMDVKRKALAFAETEVPTDNDPATWERGETRLTLPAGTQVVLLRVHAFKQNWRDAATPELIGHYADDVRLEIIHESSPQP